MKTQIPALLAEAEFAASLGHVLPPVETLIEHLATGSQLEKRLLYAGLRDLLDGTAPVLTASERDQIRERLEHLRESPDLETERQGLLNRLDDGEAAVPTARAAGVAQALLVCVEGFRGEAFGIVQPLHVHATPSGSGVAFAHRTGDETVHLGFEQGVWAARQVLMKHGLGDLVGASLLNSYSLEGTFARLPYQLPIAGPSMALPTAMAVISAITGLVLDTAVAFTGALDPSGQIHPVAGVHLKLVAAAQKQIARVYVPASGTLALQAGGNVDLRRVDRLDDVVEAEFGAPALRAALKRLRDGALPEVRRRPSAWDVGEAGPGERRVLLTFASKADPFGRYLDRERRPVGREQKEKREEGPALTVSRMVRPHALHVLYTERPSPWNDYREHAETLRQALAQIDPACDVRLHALSEVTDPSDYDQVVPAMAQSVREIVAMHEDSAAYFVGVSSGSPQMETVWHLLIGFGALPRGTRRLQVREGRWATGPGESRVREMELPDLSVLARILAAKTEDPGA